MPKRTAESTTARRRTCRESTPSSVYLSTVSDPEHQDNQFIVLNVIDDSVVTDANSELTVTALQLDAPGRAWIACERLDRIEQSTGHLLIEFPNDLCRGGDITDRVWHRTGSEVKLPHELIVGHSPLLVASLESTADVSLILQRPQRSVEELGRHDHCTATGSARGDLDRLSLRRSDVVALLATELRQGHGSHDPTVQLVQVVLKRWAGHPDVESGASCGAPPSARPNPRPMFAERSFGGGGAALST